LVGVEFDAGHANCPFEFANAVTFPSARHNESLSVIPMCICFKNKCREHFYCDGSLAKLGMDTDIKRLK